MRFPSRLHLEGVLEVWARRLNDDFCCLIEGAAVQLHRGRCSFFVGVTIVAQRQAPLAGNTAHSRCFLNSTCCRKRERIILYSAYIVSRRYDVTIQIWGAKAWRSLQAFYRRERDSSERPYEEAEMQRKTLKRWKNFQRRYMFRKGCRNGVEDNPKKSWIETEAGINKKKLGRRLAWWGSTEKKEASHLLGLRGRHQYSDQHSNPNRAPCVASTAVGTEE